MRVCHRGHCIAGILTCQHLTFILHPVQLGLHLCNTPGDLFRATAEVHLAELIQLRQQVVYFSLLVGLFFLQGVDQRFLFGNALFQQKDVIGKGSAHKSSLC